MGREKEGFDRAGRRPYNLLAPPFAIRADLAESRDLSEGIHCTAGWMGTPTNLGGTSRYQKYLEGALHTV
jgi:hypothetical protein